MQIADIHHVSLNVSDLERSVGFYRDVLGMHLLPRPEMPCRASGSMPGMAGRCT